MHDYKHKKGEDYKETLLIIFYQVTWSFPRKQDDKAERLHTLKISNTLKIY